MSAKRLFLRQTAALVVAAIACVPAMAQEGWKPVKPIRIVVGFAAGGPGDIIARAVAEPMGRMLGQSVIVENKPGASGAIAQEYVNTAAPDGYTLFVGVADTQAINPLVTPNYRVDAAAMTSVAPVITSSLLLCGSKAWGPKTLREAVDAARSTGVSYAHWGAGSIGQLGMEALKKKANLSNLVGVQFPGVAPGLQALMGNHVQMMILPAINASTALDRLTCYATVSRERSAFAKDLPTTFEMGYDISSDSYMGIFGPPKMPKRIVEALHKAVAESVAEPAVTERFKAMGMSPHFTTTSEEYDRWIQQDRGRWKEVVRASGTGLTSEK